MRFQHHKTGTIARLAILLMALLAGEARAIDKVIFDRPASALDHRREYANALLRQVMERTVPEFGPYTIRYAETHMERPRLFEALKEGRLVNVTAYPADARWLKELLAVPVPSRATQCARPGASGSRPRKPRYRPRTSSVCGSVGVERSSDIGDVVSVG